MAERIYLDTCAINRLTDDHSQTRVRSEAEAVARVLELVADRQLHWVASSAVRSEIFRNPYPLLRLAAIEVLSTANEFIEPSLETLLFARQLEFRGLAAMDAIHLATAEQGKAVFLLTTDHRFVRQAFRLGQDLVVRVLNPVEWSQRRQ